MSNQTDKQPATSPAAPCSAVWRREPPDSPGNWLAWTTKEWEGKTYGYMHCVCAYWSPGDFAPDRKIAWCVPWKMYEWEGALWSGPVNPPNDQAQARGLSEKGKHD